ncbi:cilia- and flagella-associated protein 300-like [Haliotis rufescens]|uniref:cilia- and flagella-associated protein 300-like n=1 Tax=Haliotis rufescens TaxID=6454 RepID=UPI00201F39BA|nr:cilia- and flagella-associated protein 300-like [Haliotis rufescens]
MADREVKFSFKQLSGKRFDVVDGKDNQDDLLKWSMKGRIKLQMYSFDQPFQAYQKERFVQDFMNDPEILSTLQTVSATCRWSPVGIPAKSVKVKAVPCSVLSMSFFDRLYENNIARENGHLHKCLDEFYEDFTIADELRKVLLLEDSDNYDTFSDADRDEFLFRLFKHVCLGGKLCQYEDMVDKYLEFTKTLYKDLISVQKNPETKELSIVSNVFSIQAEDEKENMYYPADTLHEQNFSYLVVDPLKRHVTVLFHKFGSSIY